MVIAGASVSLETPTSVNRPQATLGWLSGVQALLIIPSRTYRTSRILSRPVVHDCLFLFAIAILSLSSYITGLGFYSDDWSLLSYMKLSADQSITAVFTAVNSSWDHEIRPVQFFLYAACYKFFGLNPLGYHIFNGIFFCTGMVLLYVVLTTLRQPRVVALSIPVLYMLLPDYSTDRFWMAAHAANISMCLTFLGIYSHLRALGCNKGEFWVWEALAILCVIVSGLSYEVFLPLFVATTIFLFVSELSTDWPHSINGRTIARAALRHVVIVLAVALVIIVKALWSPRASYYAKMRIVDYIVYVSHSVVKAFVYSYGYHLLELPGTVWNALSDYYNPTAVIAASFVGIFVFFRLYTSWDRCGAAALTSMPKMLIYLCFGIALFIAGYSLVPINPAKDGFNNRAAIAGTLGVAVSTVGLLGMLTSLAPVVWQKVLFSTVVSFIGMSGTLIIDVVANFWVQSYRRQIEALSDIRSHMPEIPAGTTLILDGVCPYIGPAPVFESEWDLAFALMIYYGHADINANIVSRRLTVGSNGLIFQSMFGPVVHPFDELYVYHFGRKESYALPDAQTAKNYFENVSTDRADRCPPDFYGNGVDALGGVIPMLGYRPPF